MTKKIYLDYAATTPVDLEVFKAMQPYFSDKFGNPSSLHSFGQGAMAAVDESREKIAEAIGGDFHEIIFTGSATEANNMALRGVIKSFVNPRTIALQKQNNFSPAEKFSSPSARYFRFAKNQAGAPAGCSSEQFVLDQNFLPLRIIVSSIEHESILETCRDLEKEGVEVIYLPVNRQGFVDLKKLKESLNERTILVSIMYANNEIGTIQNIPKISEIIGDFKKEKSKQNTNQLINQLTNYPLLHTDAVQAFQFLDCDVNKLGVDLMTLSSHKIYGPKGIGALYIKNNESGIRNKEFKKSLIHNSKFLLPMITGGGQEFGLRSGTENVPAIVGFAKAIELAAKNREKETKRITELTNYFWKELKKICPNAQLNNILNQKQIALQKQNNFAPAAKFSSPSARWSAFGGTKPSAPAGCSSEQFVFDFLPNILNIHFPNQNAQDLLMKLDLAGIAASSGSACSTRLTQPSHILEAIGLNEKRIKSSLRFSFGKFTTREEVKIAFKIIKKLI